MPDAQTPEIPPAIPSAPVPPPPPPPASPSVPPPPPIAPSPSASASDTVPDEVKGWSWGGFLWTWIWAIGNNTWIGLLALIPLPLVSLIMAIVLGVKGREWAWKNKHWNSVEDFKRVQRAWVKWWFIIMVPLTILFIALYAFVIIAAINPAGQIEKANQTRDMYLNNSVQNDNFTTPTQMDFSN